MNRREFTVVGAAALASWIAPTAHARQPKKWPPYANTLAIDALGGVFPSNADGSFSERDLADVRESGLSQFGHEVIAGLNDRRILVDVAHGGRRTIKETIAASKVPVTISHTGCAALSDLPRNVPDEILRAMADRGGVAGIIFWPYLRRDTQPMAEDVIRHIEHAIKVCGEDHVGIGTDGNIPPMERTAEFEQQNREWVQMAMADGMLARNRLQHSDEHLEHLIAQDADPAEALERNDRIARLTRVLETLSPKCRAVIVMHRRDGMTYEEIAAQMNLSVAMVKKYLARGLAACHRQMGPSAEDA